MRRSHWIPWLTADDAAVASPLVRDSGAMVPPEPALMPLATVAASAPWLVTAWVAAWANWSVLPAAAVRAVAADTTSAGAVAISCAAFWVSLAATAAARRQGKSRGQPHLCRRAVFLLLWAAALGSQTEL